MIENEVLNAVKAIVTIPDSVFLGIASSNAVVPYVVIHKVSNPRQYTHDGRIEMSLARIQVTVYGDQYVATKLLAQEIYALGDYTSANVASSFLANEVDLYDESTERFGVALDFLITHYESENN